MIKFTRGILVVVLVAFLGMRTFAQPVIGEWTDYQSYASAQNLVDTGDKVYCVTSGGLFSYTKSDGSIQKISGVSGLSDTGVKRLAYSAENRLLLIAYQNGNIDLLVGNRFFNISDIKRKQLSGDKTINNILFVGNQAYLSCGFGIVVLNLEKREIKETYLIGQDGSYLNVFDLATDGNYFYAATESGVYKANAHDSNLQDFRRWNKETSIPQPNGKFNKIEFFGGKIIANFTTSVDVWGGDRLYMLSAGSWSPLLTNTISYANDITSTAKYLVVSTRDEVWVFDTNFDTAAKIPLNLFGDQEDPLRPNSALIDASNMMWVADANFGLFKVGTKPERIIPEGPIDNMIYSLYTNGEDLWVASGGISTSWGNMGTMPQFQLSRNSHWSAFDRHVVPKLNDFKDIVCVRADPNDPDHVYASSWGGGLLEFKNGTFVKQYNNFNSTLQTVIADKPDEPFVRVAGMDFDSKGNLWMSNSEVANNVSVLKKDGTWESFNISAIANGYSVGKLIVTRNDDKWLLMPRDKGYGVAVLNSKNTESIAQKVTARFVNSDGEYFTEMSDVYSMTEDREGQIWIGTSAGVAVFSDPSAIWTDGFIYASRPGLDLKDGYFHPLLENEKVTAIAVDGANRKWLGTRASGVYLVSADGTTEIEHFTTENSPLPSDEIMDIAINDKSGEVFIGTSLGLISYMGDAVRGQEAFNDVYVYPNPVRETYDGPIVIKGLLENTDVKITDISGDLVYKTKSLGGLATWDGKNLNGKRCKTGVYLVFLTDETGLNTKITRFLMIH